MRRISFRLALPAAFLLTIPAWAASADRPNMAGHWQLDTSKGDAAEKWGAPVKQTIEQDGSNIHIVEVTRTADGKEQSLDIRCNTMGQDCKVKAPGHNGQVSFWYNGPMLVEMDTGLHGKDTVLKRRIKLSDDGKTLVMELIPLVPPGKPAETVVLVKQADGPATQTASAK